MIKLNIRKAEFITVDVKIMITFKEIKSEKSDIQEF